jgi:hypothetical protein
MAVTSEGAGWIDVGAVAEDTAERQGVVGARIRGPFPVAYSASQGISSQWFFASVGVENIRDERETWYFTRAPVGVEFVNEHVMCWTHWAHAVYVRVKDALEKGAPFPERLEYGPPRFPDKIKLHDVGPVVRYFFRAGTLDAHKFHWAPGKIPAAVAAEVPALPAAVEEVPVEQVQPPRFGLRDIVDLMDWDQSEQIRGKMAGICLIEGGPGVGKTSVALHRIPYLLREQKDVLPMENSTWPTDFFDESNVQVIVWKEHLVRYLKDLLGGLYCHQVAVRHIDEWVTDLLRRYVDVGAGPDKYRIQRPSEEDKQAEQMKLGLGKGKGHWCGISLEMIETFLTGSQGGASHRAEADESRHRFRAVIGQVTDHLAAAGLTPVPTEPSSYHFTAAGIHEAAESLRRTLDDVEETIRARERGGTKLERDRGVLSRARERVGQFRNAEMARLAQDHAATLFELYRSELLRRALAHHFTAAEIGRFRQHVDQCAARRSLSSGDRYVLLWIVRVLTRNADVEKPQLRPLPLYAHTVVDEAQHYHPLVLRLLVDLSMPKLHSMTIAGDLEQRMSQVEGLDDWKDIGIPPGLITHAYRLKTNYRWSREVFRFLDYFRKQASLKEELSAPPRWVSGEGRKPEVIRSANPDAQAEWLVWRIDQLQRDERARAWSVAVVVPAREDEWCRRVLEELQACGILARWAEGQDVHGCIEQVIMTTYESVVGLEFDAVFLPRCDEKLPGGSATKDLIQAVWVALTRARQYLAVSHSNPLAVLEAPVFAPYRKQYPPR